MSDITANVVVSMPSQLFTMARSFKAVANGKIYIGKIDTDPVNPENQIQVYVENEDGSHVPVSQPIIINAAGYPVYNGQIAKFVTVQGHSMAVYDAYGAKQFYFPNVLKYDPDQYSKIADSKFELSEFYRHGLFSSGGVVNNSTQAMQDASGMWWVYTGMLPHNVSPGTDPELDPLWFCVGLINGKELNDLASWCDVTTNNDVTAITKKFFRSMKHFGLSAVIRGKIKITDKVECFDVPYDMSECELTIPLNLLTADALNNGYIFNTSDPDEKTLSSFTVDFSLRGADSSSVLKQFGDCTFAWEAENQTTDKAYLRSNGQVIMKAGICVSTVTDRAIFRSTPLLYTVSGTVTAYVKPFRNRITIKLPKVILEGNYIDMNTQLENVFMVSRNNVEIIGSISDSASGSQTKVRSMIAIQRCAFSVVDGLSFSGSIMDYEYAISYFNVSSLTVRNCNFPRGWAFLDGNFARNIVVEKCTIAGKFGGHVGVWGFTVRDCKMYGISLPGRKATGGLSFVGGGTVLIENCEYFYSGGNHAEESLFGTRQDYGQAHEGDVIIRNIDVWYNANNVTFNGVYLAGAYPSTADYTRPYCFFGRRIIVENIRIRPATTNLASSAIKFRAVGFSRANEWTMIQRFPDNVTIRDIKAYNNNGTSGGLHLVLDLPGYQSDTTRWARSTFNCDVLSVDIQGGLSFILPMPGPGVDDTLIPSKITFKDCIGRAGLTIAGRGDDWEFINMDLDNIYVSPAHHSALTFKIQRCNLHATTCGSNNAGDKWYFYENHGVLSPGTLNIGSRAVYCHGNTCQIGGAISGRTLSEWWEYRDASVFRTS